MKASELRIGNWVLTALPDRKIMLADTKAQVQSISIFGEAEFFHTPQTPGFKMPVKHIMGIPLTEEWALKLGLKDDEPHNEISLDEYGGMTLCFNQYSKMVSLFSAGAHYYMPDIKHVHQLQNLYFALTGEELTIKE